jgi:hypothetical protein
VRIPVTGKLFDWKSLDDAPDLVALKLLLEMLPDEKILSALRLRRYKGRNDYPVPMLWRVHLLRYFLRHPTMEHCLAELRRNAALRELAFIATVADVPKPWNISRFEEVLGETALLALLRGMFEQLIRKLGSVVPDLGHHTAGDSACLNARGDGPDDQRDKNDNPLPQPSGGRKEYRNDDGVVSKVYEWFGYKFHLLVDVKHEVILAWHVTSATESDAGQIPELIRQAKGNLPDGRIETMTYDKAADDVKTHTLLREQNIKPVVQNRQMWREEEERMLPGHDGNSNIVYNEAGTVFCYDKVSEPPVRHTMAYTGYEKSRGTLKYRCPARHEGWTCPSAGRCNKDKPFGKTVRVKQAIDLRRFPPIPRATMEFERRYKGRTAIERVNARCKLFWGADDGNVKGAKRFHAHIATIMVVHALFATALAAAPRYEGKSFSPVKLSTISLALYPGNPANST